MLTFLKLAQEEVNVYVAGFFRFLFGFLIIFPYMLKSKFTVFKTNHHKKHFLKSGFKFTFNAVIFLSFSDDAN